MKKEIEKIADKLVYAYKKNKLIIEINIKEIIIFLFWFLKKIQSTNTKQIKELKTIILNGWLMIDKSIKNGKRIKFIVKILSIFLSMNIKIQTISKVNG